MAYRPRVKYQADAKFPLTTMMNISVIRKRISKNNYVNFTDKADLVDFVDSLYEPPTSDTYLQAICSCGMDHSYTTSADVPSSDLTCTCGRVILKYGS